MVEFPGVPGGRTGKICRVIRRRGGGGQRPVRREVRHRRRQRAAAPNGQARTVPVRARYTAAGGIPFYRLVYGPGADTVLGYFHTGYGEHDAVRRLGGGDERGGHISLVGAAGPAGPGGDGAAGEKIPELKKSKGQTHQAKPHKDVFCRDTV